MIFFQDEDGDLWPCTAGPLAVSECPSGRPLIGESVSCVTIGGPPRWYSGAGLSASPDVPFGVIFRGEIVDCNAVLRALADLVAVNPHGVAVVRMRTGAGGGREVLARMRRAEGTTTVRVEVAPAAQTGDESGGGAT